MVDKITEKNLLLKIKEIERLKSLKNEPFKKVIIAKLKREVLIFANEDPLYVGDYVIIKSYLNKDKEKPYLAIYTSKGWINHNKYYSGKKYKSA